MASRRRMSTSSGPGSRRCATCRRPAAPIGLVDGLPVGLQIVGAEGEDPTGIEFARLLAQEIGGFVPPPGYA